MQYSIQVDAFFYVKEYTLTLFPIGTACTYVCFLLSRTRTVSSRNIAFLFGFCFDLVFACGGSRFASLKCNASDDGFFNLLIGGFSCG